jgi:hypothetical protein
MKIFILILSLLFSLTLLNTEENTFKQNIPLYETAFITPCPNPNEINKSIVEDFLTKSYWSSERAETNTTLLTVSQVSVLTDANNSSICTSLNDTYQEALVEENGLGEPANNVTYYKAGTFYIVVISIRQSDDPNYMTTGINFIDVYNQNLDLIKGYAF